MAKPLVVSFSHELSKADVVKRIDDGIVYLKDHYSSFITVAESTWTGDRLEFVATAVKQTIRGFVDVEDNRVTITVTLPLLLAMMADTARSLIVKEGNLLLEKK